MLRVHLWKKNSCQIRVNTGCCTRVTISGMFRLWLEQMDGLREDFFYSLLIIYLDKYNSFFIYKTTCVNIYIFYSWPGLTARTLLKKRHESSVNCHSGVFSVIKADGLQWGHSVSLCVCTVLCQRPTSPDNTFLWQHYESLMRPNPLTKQKPETFPPDCYIPVLKQRGDALDGGIVETWQGTKCSFALKRDKLYCLKQYSL